MENFIFIVGCGHSGTTIVNKIISNHKNIFGFNYETYLFIWTTDKIPEKLNDFNKKKKEKNGFVKKHHYIFII